MKVYYNDNVVQAALKRTRFIYQHFGDKTYVSFSGGKDSTVCLELAHIVAEEMGLLPVNVMWLDQEAEWGMTVEYAKRVFSLPWVKPYWIQTPFILDCSLNGHDGGLKCWEGDTIREKDPNSIHEIPGSKDKVFYDTLDLIQKELFKDGCTIYGMRCEESPNRYLGLVTIKKFVGPEVWGAVSKPKRAAVIYDWSTSDVWKFISEHDLDYNRLYDFQYAKGLPIFRMRVSSLIHETAFTALDYAQELEGEMWEKLTERIHGINTYKHCPEAYQIPKKLPVMFQNWREYRDFLLIKLIQDEKHLESMKKAFERDDKKTPFYPKDVASRVYLTHIKTILADDYYLTGLTNLKALTGKYDQAIVKKTGGVI
ncbi:MAG: phosphoadenosine phosphosulfate reductase family protein [Treponema sp.]|nr:phosphoadenosine phosphosulfate reductase family protein [Treponema sp.]